MEEDTSNQSTSPYMFRPILEPSTVNDESVPRSYHSHNSIHSASTPYQTDRLSLMERSGSSRMRVPSGGTISSPTVGDGIQKRPPKLSNCWRTNPESWSSTGSRHSSRPGSSQASSRPPSQCNNVVQQQGPSAIPSTLLSSNLYSKSTNNSNSDVALTQKNFQKLSVSSRINAECRRAAFKSQKWSNSFDQTCVAASSPSSGSTASQASPGRRRQSSLQQPSQHQPRSLDLPDSGYSGASSVDLGKSWYSQSSWDPTSQLNSINEQQQQIIQGNTQLLKQFSNTSSAICVSPIETAKQELEELKSELGDSFSPIIITTSGSCRTNSSLRQNIVEQNISQDDMNKEDEIARRSASLPSFPDSFIPNIVGRGNNLNNSYSAQLQQNAPQDISIDSINMHSIINPDTNYSNVLVVDEPLDVLDKEIEMILAPTSGDLQQQKTPTTSEVLNFLEEYEEDDALNDHYRSLKNIEENPSVHEPQRMQHNNNPFFLRAPPLSRDNSGGSSGEYNKQTTSNVPTSTIITATTSQEQKQIKTKMNFLAPPITTQPSRSCDNTLGVHWPYTNKNNKRSLFARTMQQRASFNNDESSPQTQVPSLKAFHHSLDDGYGGEHQPKNVHVTNRRSESSNLLASTTATSIMSQTASRASYMAAPALITTSRGANTISGNSVHTIICSKYHITYYHILR